MKHLISIVFVMALIFQGKVVQIEPDGKDFPVSPALVWVQTNNPNVKVGWLYDGTLTPPPLPPPAPPDLDNPLHLAIENALTIRQLKDALLGTNTSRPVKGRSP